MPPLTDEARTDLTAAHAHLNRAADLARKHGLDALAGVINQLARFVYELLFPPNPPPDERFEHTDERRG